VEDLSEVKQKKVKKRNASKRKEVAGEESKQEGTRGGYQDAKRERRKEQEVSTGRKYILAGKKGTNCSTKGGEFHGDWPERLKVCSKHLEQRRERKKRQMLTQLQESLPRRPT
jgi:hypothetical protein